jgi:hypothetical protein
LGRVDLSEGQSIEAFIDDSTGSGGQSVWYDGIGYAPVLSDKLAGDFDYDGDVDGRDFLVWQRGESPNPLNADDLADWQTNYEISMSSQVSSAVPVPEPHSVVVWLSGLYCFLTRHCSVVR